MKSKLVDQIATGVTIGLVHIIGFWMSRRLKLKQGETKMQVVDIKLGAEGDANVSLVGGKIQIQVSENTPGLDGALQINIPLSYFLEALKAKLNNNALAVSIINIIEGVLASMP